MVVPIPTPLKGEGVDVKMEVASHISPKVVVAIHISLKVEVAIFISSIHCWGGRAAPICWKVEVATHIDI